MSKIEQHTLNSLNREDGASKREQERDRGKVLNRATQKAISSPTAIKHHLTISHNKNITRRKDSMTLQKSQRATEMGEKIKNVSVVGLSIEKLFRFDCEFNLRQLCDQNYPV